MVLKAEDKKTEDIGREREWMKYGAEFDCMVQCFRECMLNVILAVDDTFY